MEDPAHNPQGNRRGLHFKDSANTDIIFHNGKLLATWYLCGAPYALEPTSLDTLGAEDFAGTLDGDMMAHPKVDERTGELFWFDYGPSSPYMRYGVVGASGRVEHVVPIELAGPRLPHDMAITEHYAILMDLPLIQNEEARRAGRYKLTFDSSLPSRFGVIPRRGAPGDIRWFEAKPCYIYHVVNAWKRRRDRPRRLPRVPTRTGHRRADPPREAAGLPQTRCPHAPVPFRLGVRSDQRIAC